MGKLLKQYEKLFAAIRANDRDALREGTAEGFTMELPGVGLVDFEGMLQATEAWRRGFSNFGKNRTVLFVAEGTLTLAVRHRMSMKHDGSFRTQLGVVAPTARTISMVSADLLSFGRDGNVRNWAVVFDSTELATQLGLM